MRCRSPVRRLNRVLLPELGLPTTAMLASARRLTGIWLAGTRISLVLVTARRYRGHGELPGLLLAKRDTATEQPELHGIAAKRGARQLDDRALDETERHEALDLRVCGVH